MSTWSRGVWIAGLLLGSSHCGGDDGGTAPAGQETGPCVAGTCLQGLMCLSNICVDPDGANTSTGDPTTSGTSTSTSTTDGDVGPGLPCNPYTQDCIAGYKCAPQPGSGNSTYNEVVCTPLDDNPVELGEACMRTSGPGGTLLDNCGEGAFCDRAYSPDNVGTCAEMCGPPVDEPTCATPDTLCHVGSGGNLPLCRERCDPLIVDCSIQNDVCIPDNDGDGFFCFSQLAGLGDYGAPCYSAINTCDPGLLCNPIESFPDGTCLGNIGCCGYLCDLDAPACPGQVPNCVPWFPPGEAPAGDEDVGYCSI